MNQILISVIFAAALFAGLLGCLCLGWTMLETPRDLSNTKSSGSSLAKLNLIQAEIWEHLVDVTKRDRSLPLAQTVLPPANEMFDLGNSRLLASRQHPPVAVFGMLGVLVLVSGLLAGFGMAKSDHQSPLHVLGFSAIMALSIYLILDIEYPRLGLIRIDSFDQALIELRASMN